MLSKAATLSLNARVAIGLHLFADYCEQRELDQPEISRYLEHMWAFVALPGGGVRWDEWESSRSDLEEAGLGYDYPQGFQAYLATKGVAESEFRTTLMHTTEILYGSLYGAADNSGSLRHLEGLAAIAELADAEWPDLSVFTDSRWQGNGWGNPLPVGELERWRAAKGQ